MDAIRVRTSRVSTPGRRAPRARGGAGGAAGAGEGRTHPDDDGAAVQIETPMNAVECDFE